MSNRYTAEQATDAIAKLDLDKLSPKELEEELKSIIKDLDTTPYNTTNRATTVLYSASSVDDIEKNDNFRILNNTEAYNFLEQKALEKNKPLIHALYKAYGETPNFDNWTSQAGIFIGGDDSTMPRVGGAWDTISENFVHGAEGNVVTNIGDNAKVNRVFFQTELPAVKANDKITHINDIDKSMLFDELDKLETPQHQMNYFKEVTYKREAVFNVLKESEDFTAKSALEVTDSQVENFLNTNTPEVNAIKNQIDTYKVELFTKAEVSKVTGIHNDKISDDEIKTFLSQESDSSKAIVDKIENHVKELSENNPHIKNFDVSTHGKYAVLGAVGASIFSTTQAEASSIPTLHLNDHLDKNKFDSLPTNEKVGVEVSTAFNAINAIQAGEEFKAGASKSATVLLDTNAYKQGLEQATDAWKPSATKEIAKTGVIDSAKVAGKSLLRRLPGIGLGLGMIGSVSRASQGDFKGAGMELLSGVLSLLPGWGTAGSVVIDGMLSEHDTGILSHGVEQLLGKENEETLTQSEDNHTTIEPNQNLNLSSDVEKDGFEYNEDGMLILTGDNVVSIDDIAFVEEESYDSLDKAQEKIAELFPEFQINHTTNQQENQRVEEPREEKTSSYETQEPNSPYVSNDNIVYSEEDTLPKNHRPINLQNNLAQQPLEENQLIDEEQFRQAEQRIYDNIAQKYGGSNDDYGNDYDMGMD